MKHNKIDNYDNGVTNEQNPNWPQIPIHAYKILVIRDSGSGKVTTQSNTPRKS